METSDFRPEVEIRPFRSYVMHPAIIIGTVRSLWTWLWGRYHVPQNVFLVIIYYYYLFRSSKYKYKLNTYTLDSELEQQGCITSTNNCPYIHTHPSIPST